MKKYEILQATKGYLVTGMSEYRGETASEIYAFSTLKEAQEYLPTIFEPESLESTKKKPSK